jgi:uncharacterized Rmd1/YagE family protein
MGHATFAEMLDQLVQFREELQIDHRQNAIRANHRLDHMESMLQALLEKLRDVHDPK